MVAARFAKDIISSRLKRNNKTMIERLKKMMPSQESMQNNRWLRWMGPRLFHPRLWRMHRKAVALGVGIGVFFAFLIPIAQIPLSAILSMWLRANIPAAALATIVNTPLTFPPVYYAAWELGRWMLSFKQPDVSSNEAGGLGESTLSSGLSETGLSEASRGGAAQWIELLIGQMDTIGKPMALGAFVFACVFSVLAYALVQLVWIKRVRRRRASRLMQCS
jgi:uncharacterized protein (DUF2062 family)